MLHCSAAVTIGEVQRDRAACRGLVAGGGIGQGLHNGLHLRFADQSGKGNRKRAGAAAQRAHIGAANADGAACDGNAACVVEGQQIACIAAVDSRGEDRAVIVQPVDIDQRDRIGHQRRHGGCRINRFDMCRSDLSCHVNLGCVVDRGDGDRNHAVVAPRGAGVIGDRVADRRQTVEVGGGGEADNGAGDGDSAFGCGNGCRDDDRVAVHLGDQRCHIKVCGRGIFQHRLGVVCGNRRVIDGGDGDSDSVAVREGACIVGDGIGDLGVAVEVQGRGEGDGGAREGHSTLRRRDAGGRDRIGFAIHLGDEGRHVDDHGSVFSGGIRTGSGIGRIVYGGDPDVDGDRVQSALSVSHIDNETVGAVGVCVGGIGVLT